MWVVTESWRELRRRSTTPYLLKGVVEAAQRGVIQVQSPCVLSHDLTIFLIYALHLKLHLLYSLQHKVLKFQFPFLLSLKLGIKSGWSLWKIQRRWSVNSPCRSTCLVAPWITSLIALILLVSPTSTWLSLSPKVPHKIVRLHWSI